MAEQLQAKLGVPVKFVPAITSSAAMKAFTSNEVQLGWFGGFMGVRVRHQAPNSQALAQTAEDAAFRFYLIAHDKTGLKPSKDFPKEIAGKSFAFWGAHLHLWSAHAGVLHPAGIRPLTGGGVLSCGLLR